MSVALIAFGLVCFISGAALVICVIALSALAMVDGK